LWAATIIVDETTCTLVDAVTAANTDAAVGGCPAGSGADTIELTTDVTLATIDNNGTSGPGDNGLPLITSDITVEGAGFVIERDPGAPPFRFFQINSPVSLTLNDVTLSNGSTGSTGAGGAIYSRYATLILTNSTVSGNTAGGGGGIWSYGPTTLTKTTVSGNTASVNAGGVYLDQVDGWPELINCVVSDNVAGSWGGGIAGEVRVINSLITGNSAEDGGGIYGGGLWGWHCVLLDSLVTGNVAGRFGGGVYGCHVALTNSTVSNNQAYSGGGIRCLGLEATDSTISNNSASGWGGGITDGWDIDLFAISDLKNVTISGNTAAGFCGGFYTGFHQSPVLARFLNSTISGNTASSGGGLCISDTTATSIELRNTIVANSGSGGNCVGHVGGFIDLGSNFADDDTCGPDFKTITGFDPSLADNGGPTQTHALLPGSNAIDAAGSCGLATDQRGFPRNDGACDSGSYEFQCSIAVTKDEVDTLIWFTPDTSGFQIVAGYLSDLLADKDFSQARCLGTYLASPAVDTLPEPPEGDGRYYLARGLTNCEGAQYGDSSLTPDPRNQLILISCP
jgi:parallel beta-helix repeat protein